MASDAGAVMFERRRVGSRILRGPEPPTGVVYRPEPTWRCRLGVHLWRDVWEFTRLEHDEREVEEDGWLVGEVNERLSVNLDRPADYTSCVWCKRMRHGVWLADSFGAEHTHSPPAADEGTTT